MPDTALISITPLYAAPLALLFIALSVNVVLTRFKHRVSVGDGGEKLLIKAMRTHANCAEYTPLGLLLVLLLELQRADAALVHIAGALLLLGRLVHAFGFGRTPQIVPLRKAGMYLTFASLLFSASAGLLLAL